MIATVPVAALRSLTVLARIGGLPADSVPLASAEVVSCLDELDDIEERLAALTQPLLDRLFDAVPAIAEDRARRSVLQAKRLVFAGRPIPTSTAEAVLAAVPADTAAAFEAWRVCLSDAEGAGAQLGLLVDQDDAAMRTALRHTIDDELYLSSLALATPELVARLVHGAPLRRRPERLIRTLYNYATRAALKTSPFSGLTTVSIAGAQGGERSTRTVAMHLAYGLLSRAVHDGADHPGLVLSLSPTGTIPAEEHKRLVMLSHHVHHDGIIFREETVAGAEWMPREYPDAFAPGLPTARMRRYVEAGLLREQLPWRRGEDPFLALSTAFPEGIAGVTSSEMRRAGVARDDCSTIDAQRRLDVLSRLARLSERVFDRGELGERPSGLLYEDRESVSGVPDVFALAPVREDIEDLSSLMSPWVFRSYAYDLMVNRFVARYGVGGRCSSPLSFCMALAVDNDGDRELATAFARNQRATAEEAAERSLLQCGSTAAPRHLGVMLQMAAPDWEHVSSSDHLVVVNSVGNGIGAYPARFHRLFGECFRRDLGREISQLWPTRRVLELIAWAECNTGQAVCAGVLPELQLPGEPTSSHGVPLESLMLRHDPVADSLELWDDDGPVGLAYLGLTPQHLLNTYLRWVAMLADPWVRFPPYCEAYATICSGRQRCEEGTVIHEPRQTAGRRLVTRRESWFMTAATLMDRTSADDRLSIRRLHEFRRRHGIPQYAFVQQLDTGGGTTNNHRKPQFVDFASNVSVTSLGHWLSSRMPVLRVTEALPGPGMHPHRDEAGRPRVCEFAVSMHWPRRETA